MHIVEIKTLKEINKKTKAIKSLNDIYEKQRNILSDVIYAAKQQECKNTTMLTSDEWSYFNIDFLKLSKK